MFGRRLVSRVNGVIIHLMKYIQNFSHVKDTASSIDCMDYISRATDLDANTYTIDTCGERKESDKKLPAPKCNFLQSRTTQCHEFCLNSASLNEIKNNLKKENKPLQFSILSFFPVLVEGKKKKRESRVKRKHFSQKSLKETTVKLLL